MSGGLGALLANAPDETLNSTGVRVHEVLHFLNLSFPSDFLRRRFRYLQTRETPGTHPDGGVCTGRAPNTN